MHKKTAFSSAVFTYFYNTLFFMVSYTPLCSQFGAVYFAATGGAAALISNSIKSCEVIAYEELGAEAVHKLYVEDFPAVVVMDANGGNLYESEKAKYRKL